MPPPMPERVQLAATVRDLGSRELPVAELTFVDVLGEQLVLQLSPRTLMNLLSQAVRFLEQVGGFDG